MKAVSSFLIGLCGAFAQAQEFTPAMTSGQFNVEINVTDNEKKIIHGQVMNLIEGLELRQPEAQEDELASIPSYKSAEREPAAVLEARAMAIDFRIILIPKYFKPRN